MKEKLIKKSIYLPEDVWEALYDLRDKEGRFIYRILSDMIISKRKFYEKKGVLTPTNSDKIITNEIIESVSDEQVLEALANLKKISNKQ